MLELSEAFNDYILFIVLVEKWKTAYPAKEPLWKKIWLSNNILRKFGKNWKHKAKNHT